MDLEPKSDGRSHFVLGPVEKWVISAVAVACIALAGWLVNSVQTLLTQQAVTNSQLDSLNKQLAGVPELNNRVSRLEVRVEAVEKQLDELRTTRNLR